MDGKHFTFALGLALAAAGCGAGPTVDRHDEEVGKASEALNGIAFPCDFFLSLQAVHWQCSTCKVPKGQLAQTNPLDQIALGAPDVSGWATPPEPWHETNGLRLGITRTAGGIDLSGVDFRIGIEAWDEGASRVNVAMTPFASDGGGQSDYAADLGDQIDASYFALVIDVRSWPANVTKTLRDFRIGLQPCETSVINQNNFLSHICLNDRLPEVFTHFITEIAPGQSSWNPTATTADLSNIDGVRIRLDVVLL